MELSPCIYNGLKKQLSEVFSEVFSKVFSKLNARLLRVYYK